MQSSKNLFCTEDILAVHLVRFLPVPTGAKASVADLLRTYLPEAIYKLESAATHRMQQNASTGSVSSSGSQQAAKLLPVFEEMNAEDLNCFKYVSS